jgi:meso-butanediol dehydrogenase / (S,S)-butanediol dehydrogenase / diacetyl reductase
MSNSRRFVDQVVLITGASRGIGRGVALRFAQEGAHLVLCANEDRVNDVADEIRGMGCRALSAVADVREKQQVEDLFDQAVQTFGRLDVSFHNAGVITIAQLGNLTEDEWDWVLDVNTKGAFLCCQAAANHMIRQGGGKIINTASGQAREGFIYTPHYAASKFGVVGMTQSLAKELAAHSITVNAICPGIIETDMWAYNDREWGKLLGDYRSGELMQEWVDGIPMKRVGTPQDVAGLVTFLASEDANYITGQTINVDGGLIMS